MEFADAILYGVLFISLYFEVLLLITFFENAPEVAGVSSDANTDTLPTVAVIVPCWNEERTVAGTLDSLLALDYPKDKLEILAVNDGSTDNTLTVLNGYKERGVTVIDKTNGGKHTAMNEALQHTTAEFVGCLDADSFVEPDALKHIVAHFADERVAAVTPSIRTHRETTMLQVIQKAEYGIAIFIRNTFARLDALFITPGPFSFFRRSVIDEIGPWQHGHSTEDLEMCMRLQQAHKKVTNETNAIVYTTTPSTLYKLYKQRVRWTFGFLRNAVDYRHMFFNPRYGALGTIVLPMALISLFSAVSLFGIMIWNTGVLIAEQFVRFRTVGITTQNPSFDLFYVQTGAVVTATIALVVLTTVIMIIGKRLSKDTSISYDILLYLALYGFITPLWLTAAVYKAAVSKSVSWR